jgi:osmotically inducible protein OsmC
MHPFPFYSAATERRIRVNRPEVDLPIASDKCLPRARLNISLADLGRDSARALVNTSHQAHPFSKATQANIDVAINSL